MIIIPDDQAAKVRATIIERFGIDEDQIEPLSEEANFKVEYVTGEDVVTVSWRCHGQISADEFFELIGEKKPE